LLIDVGLLVPSFSSTSILHAQPGLMPVLLASDRWFKTLLVKCHTKERREISTKDVISKEMGFT
jgi:hypothetical protein